MTESHDFLKIAKKNPDSKVLLDFDSGNLELYLNNPLSFQTANNWNSPFENFLEEQFNLTDKAIKGFQQWSKSYRNTKSMRETLLYYQGSKSLDLQLDCMLIASSKNENLNSAIKPLLEMTNPDFDASNSESVLVGAPLKYAPNPKVTQGKIAVKIGRFFMSHRVYVLESCTFTASRATLPTGLPLYLHLNIGLKPFRVLSKTEVTSFFL